MSFAAAAAVGTMRGGNGRSSRRYPRAPRRSYDSDPVCTGPNVATGIASCTCSILLMIGVVAVVGSFTDDRGGKVRVYDAQVTRWLEQERDIFRSGGFAVVAVFAVSETVGNLTSMETRNISMTMNFSEEAEAALLKDSEHGQGLLDYTPHRYESTLKFDSYYPLVGSGTPDMTWPVLPDMEAAETVRFEFNAWTDNGSQSSFSTPAFPIVYDQTVTSRTPAPENKCQREQGGQWRERHCHVIYRLEELCLQVSFNSSDSSWKPMQRDLPEEATHAYHDPRFPPNTLVAYGCDPRTQWNPVLYGIDKCYGPRHTSRYATCPIAGLEAPPHAVKVTVRSASDPYILAEELTDDSFDFGLSPESQRAYGITMLVIGGCLGMVPFMRLCVHYCGFDEEDLQETRSLRYRDNDDHDSDVSKSYETAAGIYGRQTAV